MVGFRQFFVFMIIVPGLAPVAISKTAPRFHFNLSYVTKCGHTIFWLLPLPMMQSVKCVQSSFYTNRTNFLNTHPIFMGETVYLQLNSTLGFERLVRL